MVIALDQKRDAFNRQDRRIPSQQLESSFGYGAEQWEGGVLVAG
jgi:hypothetical protein